MFIKSWEGNELMVDLDRSNLLNTRSSECVQIPPTRTLRLYWTLKQSVYISSAQREAAPVNHFAVFLLSFSLCLSLWVERQAHSQLYHPSLDVDPLKRGGGFGRMFKDLFHSRLSKGKNAVKSC